MNDALIGYFAAFCTTLAFLPQVLHIIKHRDTAGISVFMYCIFVFGVALWLVYGIMLVNWPMIIANVITLILSSIVLVLKLRHG
ncbi:SemiSWEET transporter [Spartinivicinus ruber]|uniref:SemiSWEET transporter n=1 Tax=Spartinivicinus ruber TaxID=2683272 RepID=UPI0013D3C6A3|nr:SemiSWEET transporter [Spartinivicinus ruber]